MQDKYEMLIWNIYKYINIYSKIITLILIAFCIDDHNSVGMLAM